MYHPDGSFDQLIEIPDPLCTSVCFGGDDFKDLFVVSGSRGSDSDCVGGILLPYVWAFSSLPFRLKEFG